MSDIHTRTVRTVKNPFGQEPGNGGWYIEVSCPINGRDILPVGPFGTKDEADREIDSLFGGVAA